MERSINDGWGWVDGESAISLRGAARATAGDERGRIYSVPFLRFEFPSAP